MVGPVQQKLSCLRLIQRCELFSDLLNINNSSAECEKFDWKSSGINIVKENICIIDKASLRTFNYLKKG